VIVARTNAVPITIHALRTDFPQFRHEGLKANRPAADEGSVAFTRRVLPRMTDDLDQELQITVAHEGDATVLAVGGELDAASTPELQASLEQTLARDGSEAVVLDLAGCTFVDSTGLHAIIDARALAHGQGGRLEVCCTEHGPVARVIEVALPGVLDLHPTRAAALDALGR
jgi:anti-sigma B factor antagonist